MSCLFYGTIFWFQQHLIQLFTTALRKLSRCRCSALSFSFCLSGRFGWWSSALHGHHALGRDPRCSIYTPAAGCGCHLLLCQQMWPNHVPLWQIWHGDQRTQLGGGQGSFHVSISDNSCMQFNNHLNSEPWLDCNYNGLIVRPKFLCSIHICAFYFHKLSTWALSQECLRVYLQIWNECPLKNFQRSKVNVVW